MAPGSNGSLLESAHAFLDIVLPPTATAARAGSAPALDLAPAGGADFMVVGLIAAIVAAVLVLIIRSRQRK